MFILLSIQSGNFWMYPQICLLCPLTLSHKVSVLLYVSWFWICVVLLYFLFSSFSPIFMAIPMLFQFPFILIRFIFVRIFSLLDRDLLPHSWSILSVYCVSSFFFFFAVEVTASQYFYSVFTLFFTSSSVRASSHPPPLPDSTLPILRRSPSPPSLSPGVDRSPPGFAPSRYPLSQRSTLPKKMDSPSLIPRGVVCGSHRGADAGALASGKRKEWSRPCLYSKV
jgi:hypothetical protein